MNPIHLMLKNKIIKGKKTIILYICRYKYINNKIRRKFSNTVLVSETGYVVVSGISSFSTNHSGSPLTSASTSVCYNSLP